MAHVWLFASLRGVTGGKSPVTVPGTSVREVISQLEKTYPGAKAALIYEDDLMPGLAVVVDGVTSNLGLLERVGENSEVHFLPAIGGG
jgi:molybdopterin synthase sulfur carrier subunit